MKRIAILAAALALTGCGREEAEEPKAAAAEGGIIDVAQEAQRVEVGMTEAQVVEILGQPRTRVGEPSGDRLTFWTFNADKQVTARVYVMFDKSGKVVTVETIPI